MDVAALVLFASTLLLAAASPGPGVAALVARVVGRGARGAGAFAAGLILGDLVWLAVAILGLAVVAQTFHEVFLVIKYAGAGYLAYLAYRMWTAPAYLMTRKTSWKVCATTRPRIATASHTRWLRPAKKTHPPRAPQPSTRATRAVTPGRSRRRGTSEQDSAGNIHGRHPRAQCNHRSPTATATADINAVPGASGRAPPSAPRSGDDARGTPRWRGHLCDPPSAAARADHHADLRSRSGARE